MKVQSLEGFPLKDSIIFIPFISLNFLPLLSFIQHHLNTRILLTCLKFFKHIMGPQMFNMPLMQFKYICYAVYSSMGFEKIGILWEKTCVNNSSSIVFGLEVGIRETNEYYIQALFLEILAEMPHCVCSYHSNMTVVVRLFCSHPPYLLSHKINQLVSYFHPQNQLLREKRSQCKKKTSVSTTNIHNRYLLFSKRIVPLIFIEWRMFNSITVSFEIVLGCHSKVKGKMPLPVNKGMVWRIGKRSSIERIDMRPHPVIFLLRHQSLLLDHFPSPIIMIWFLWMVFLSLHKRNINNVLIW